MTQMWGGMELYEKGQELKRKYICDMRPTPIDAAFSFEYLEGLIAECGKQEKRTVKGLLTQEQLIPGLGNSIAQDIMFEAKLHPKHPIAELTKAQRKRLHYSSSLPPLRITWSLLLLCALPGVGLCCKNGLLLCSIAMNPLSAIWLIPISFFIHELEEWNILRWYKKYYRNLPDSTNTSVRIHIFALGAIGALIAALAYFSPLLLRSFLIIFFSGFILTNTIQHGIQTFQHKTYAPGLATALVCTAACVFANAVLVGSGMMFLPLYALLLLVIPAIVGTLRHKNEMTREVRKVHSFFIRMEELLRRKGGIREARH